MPLPDQLRVASLQYLLKPIRSFEEFAMQSADWVKNAADYKSQLVLFPEYFTLQLMSLEKQELPLPEMIRAVARHQARYVEHFSTLAKKHQITIAAGSIPTLASSGEVVNECSVFSPQGTQSVQGKLHMTRFEKEDFKVSSWQPAKIRVFEADWGRFAVAICYDVEFPELVRAAALQGAQLILVPSCTDDRQGYYRVRYCAQARAIENQVYVAQASTVGGLTAIPAACLNFGQAALMTPSDYGFARDGILAEGVANQESMIVGDFDLKHLEASRSSGTVLPFQDSLSSTHLNQQVELVRL